MGLNFGDWLRRRGVALEEISAEIAQQFFRGATPDVPVEGLAVALRNDSFDPRRWNGRYPFLWRAVSPEVGLPGPGAFGYAFFVDLFRLYPDLRRDVVCFQYAFQMEDTWAIFDREQVPFSVQIDPALKYIIVLDAEGYRNEIGRFGDDPEREALEVIAQKFISTQVTGGAHRLGRGRSGTS
jgi:hypothetical protein